MSMTVKPLRYMTAVELSSPKGVYVIELECGHHIHLKGGRWNAAEKVGQKRFRCRSCLIAAHRGETNDAGG